MSICFESALVHHNEVVGTLPMLSCAVEKAARILSDSVSKGGCIFWMGNGGSAADAQHYAAELMVRYARNREPIASIALTTNSSILTAHSNDYDYETVFSRQVRALAKENDVVVGISTSGNSTNVLMAILEAKAKGVKTVALLGRDGGEIAKEVDLAITVNSNITAHIQESHLIIGHYLCDYVESNFIGK